MLMIRLSPNREGAGVISGRVGRTWEGSYSRFTGSAVKHDPSEETFLRRVTHDFETRQHVASVVKPLDKCRWSMITSKISGGKEVDITVRVQERRA